MEKLPEDYLVLKERPKWDRDGGVWIILPPYNGVSQIKRWKPSIDYICWPLMGIPRTPSKDRTCRLYREGLELVTVFKERRDLFELAQYRRQLTNEGDITLDTLFLEVAESFRLTPREWDMLAERMPHESVIRRICEERAKESS